jgi:hypothetical protein
MMSGNPTNQELRTSLWNLEDNLRVADNTPGMVRALLAELAAYREHRFDTLGVRKKGQHDATIVGSAGPSVMGQVEGP